ncbi:hypothetical protein AWC05_26140 [Mycobacterium florentinum]|uniref:Uncharacterized protein n=1 Tax=Mycobacterium florentinum TaxID=292462 RepID=A0A1X1U488_MYCFL|nr:hypothetical protein [Mycobacterium florentinum]MCV7410882.1 hypothetical protein [Mycobacterium florentinum]ORV51664.1 hypothetical protein AWC05_26140 [Mycobacterium florentinum]BBX80217.1 hypothetical protein MFLOJ_40040 [Mycobacterium florentinum]
MNENSTQYGTIQLLSMVAGALVAPAITPALTWTTIATNLPLALVIVQLVAMALISNLLLHKLFRFHELNDGDRDDQATSNPCSGEPPNG